VSSEENALVPELEDMTVLQREGYHWTGLCNKNRSSPNHMPISKSTKREGLTVRHYQGKRWGKHGCVKLIGTHEGVIPFVEIGTGSRTN